MTSLMNFTKFSYLKPNSFHDGIYHRPTFSSNQLRPKFESFHHTSFKLRSCRERWSFLRGAVFKNGVLFEEKGCKRGKRVILVKNNQGFGFNFGGGGKDNGGTARVLGNLALAIGLTYLSMTGQLGWILDAIVSIWVIAVLIPIVGIGAFLWWAGRDIMQGTCPNCGNDFQVFKSSLNDDLQLCPFCGQPFSVIGNEFVKDSVKFSNQPTTFGQAFSNSSHSRNDKDSDRAIDVEAEIKDVD
ncbi:hypothetical protein TanjilG_03645 [Lupinus angustifolius]|uniref:Uncharacterized protein n=1 Tax=Lupinus angustifolius TaxID=3871 RepID=A0A1J7GXE1_LUPAN|nr:PREDICTED: uncharacterized protein LOC109357112 [Lupinus angustifolius]XP_019456390.1 PREDICTED: uncharacterized protein LOC109357112 [Lupinus angustifolius]XP_019456391.1 PREDICTED: uncharacterized protein LOC109357112 [Lupinus angustifolius]XP_019456392.1 PREDICTED: uncharacterized protein LOC109357112 [Lupinus angustifolius]OIW05256.1 hypothetical protein TanjilG_03645 [Lupinus angustifolius]